jgi:hypothetical protein
MVLVAFTLKVIQHAQSIVWRKFRSAQPVCFPDHQTVPSQERRVRVGAARIAHRTPQTRRDFHQLHATQHSKPGLIQAHTLHGAVIHHAPLERAIHENLEHPGRESTVFQV